MSCLPRSGAGSKPSLLPTLATKAPNFASPALDRVNGRKVLNRQRRLSCRSISMTSRTDGIPESTRPIGCGTTDGGSAPISSIRPSSISTSPTRSAFNVEMTICRVFSSTVSKTWFISSIMIIDVFWLYRFVRTRVQISWALYLVFMV